MSIGKAIRLKTLFRNGGRHTILVPMDHGITMGPIDGLTNIDKTISNLSHQGLDGIILHKGIITSCQNTIIESDLSLIMHLSASTTLGDRATKVLVGDVCEAVSFGCSAVSLHINFGVPNESAMLKDVAYISEKCYKYGMPLLIMAYHSNCDINTISHITRISAELGADLIKIPYPKDGGDFAKVVSSSPIPVLVAGGEIDNNMINNISKAISCGASGVAIGRNIFQSDNMVKAIKEIVNVVRKAMV